MGLSISNALVQKLGGKQITLLSAKGKGSIFSFEVDIANERAVTPPLVEEPAFASENHCQSMPACSWSGSYISSTQKVLIVDDNFMNRLVARKLVESRGYACVEVNNGLEAVQMLLSLQTCTFVLMDVEMPEMDGLAATREIRRLERAGRLETTAVIVGCSANCSLEDKEAALDSGMDYFLEKPLRREQLFELLSGHFGAGDR